MKIPKKQAILATEFIISYLADGFWPYDEGEAVLIGKIVGFGQYHAFLRVDKAYRFMLDKIGVGALPPKRSCARLDICCDEASALLEMIEEYYKSGSVEEFVDCAPLQRYLNRTFVKQESS